MTLKEDKLFWLKKHVSYPGLLRDLGPVCSPGNQAAAWASGLYHLATKSADRPPIPCETSFYVALPTQAPSRTLKKGSVRKERVWLGFILNLRDLLSSVRVSPWSVRPRWLLWFEVGVVSAVDWCPGLFASAATEMWWKWASSTAPSDATDPVWTLKLNFRTQLRAYMHREN